MKLCTTVETTLGPVDVSTVLLPAAFGGRYETCLFGPAHSQVVDMYGTEEQATAGHSHWIEKVRTAVPALPSHLFDSLES